MGASVSSQIGTTKGDTHTFTCPGRGTITGFDVFGDGAIDGIRAQCSDGTTSELVGTSGTQHHIAADGFWGYQGNVVQSTGTDANSTIRPATLRFLDKSGAVLGSVGEFNAGAYQTNTCQKPMRGFAASSDGKLNSINFMCGEVPVVAPTPTYQQPASATFSTQASNTLPRINYWTWRGKSSPDDMCWNNGDHVGRCEQIGGEYTTVGTQSCYNKDWNPVWDRDKGQAPICGSTTPAYTANQDYCCTHWNNSGDATRTCNPAWTPGSAQCSNALAVQCQPGFDQGGFLTRIAGALGVATAQQPNGTRNLFADTQCQTWCAANPAVCDAKKRAYCNTRDGIMDPNCQAWCKRGGNEGACNAGAAMLCERFPDDPFCACISADIKSSGTVTGSAALQCFDAKCISTGYKTTTPVPCTVISCDQIMQIEAGGNIRADHASFDQQCNVNASGGGPAAVINTQKPAQPAPAPVPAPTPAPVPAPTPAPVPAPVPTTQPTTGVRAWLQNPRVRVLLVLLLVMLAISTAAVFADTAPADSPPAK